MGTAAKGRDGCPGILSSPNTEAEQKVRKTPGAVSDKFLAKRLPIEAKIEKQSREKFS